LRRALFHLEQPESATTWSMAPAVLSLGAWLARDGVKVALLGEGADELFLGYAWDQVQAAEERGDDALPPDATRLLGPQVASLPLARSMARLFTPTPRARDVWLMAAGSRGAADDLDAGGARGLSGARRRQLAGLSHDLLTLPIPHADRLLMASGIEPRLPFLDHHLVELALSLPPMALESPAEDKPLLRAVARRWLPGVSLPPKAGFTGAAMPGPDELEALRRSMSFGQSRVLPSATFRARRGVEPMVQWRRCVLELTARVLFDGP
jgi:asparagine synthase (glutamine-hydrolysing)